MERIILHIDVNNAFLSWTAVEMLKNGSKVDIRTRYAIIGGDESKRRGIVLAKSNLCKTRGVYTSQPIYAARKLCPYLDVYPPNHELYRHYSNCLFDYLRQFTDVIERYSVDECFMDYTGIRRLYGEPIKFAYRIKNEILAKLGFTVNVGIGNSKLCAKMASDFTKPNKVHTLFNSEIEAKMWPLDVGDLFMIGRRSSERLHALNINTIYDLAHTDKAFVERVFKKMGTMMWEYANGIDNSAVEYLDELPKSISSSTVLPYDYRDKDKLHEVLHELALETVRRLNEVQMYANTIGIWVKFNDFTKISRQRKLDNSINEIEEIYGYVVELFDVMFDNDERGIRGVCVALNDLEAVKRVQLSIFDEARSEGDKLVHEQNDDEIINKVIGDIRGKFGKEMLDFGKNLLAKK